MEETATTEATSVLAIPKQKSSQSKYHVHEPVVFVSQLSATRVMPFLSRLDLEPSTGALPKSPTLPD